MRGADDVLGENSFTWIDPLSKLDRYLAARNRGTGRFSGGAHSIKRPKVIDKKLCLRGVFVRVQHFLEHHGHKL